MRSDVRLKSIAEDLRQGRPVSATTPRELLSWFGGQRRGSWIVWLIREALEAANLATDPSFESAYIDAPLEFHLVSKNQSSGQPVTQGEAPRSPKEGSCEGTEASEYADPTYRVSRLEAANTKPICIDPNAPIAEAVTLMMANDFSQLPVMTNDRDVKGVVSWQSIAVRLGLGTAALEVRHVMDLHYELPYEASLFQAIPIIVLHGYVLIRGKDRNVVGVVTGSDLSLQFQQLSEPFLLLGEIENHLRRVLSARLSVGELADAKDPADAGRSVERVSDLTFGEYLRVIENPGLWAKLELPIARATFTEQLHRVRSIRNDVMHFDPDGIPEVDLSHLRKVANFLRRLREIGVS